MKPVIQKLVAFLREVFSEGGQGSFSRVIQGLIVLSTCGWVTYVVLRTRAIPDLGGPATFVGAGSLHYMTNKLPDIMNAFKGGPQPPQNGQQ
jgi:hypothetical protein